MNKLLVLLMLCPGLVVASDAVNKIQSMTTCTYFRDLDITVCHQPNDHEVLSTKGAETNA